MQRVRDHARALEFLGEIDGEHDLGELALAVGGDAAVAPGQHDVREVDRLLAGRRDVDDARRRGGLQQRQQLVGQQEAREIVHREAQLVAVDAGLPARHRPCRADAGVVDQEVEAVHGAAHLVRQAAHLGQRRQVGLQEGGAAAGLGDLAAPAPRRAWRRGRAPARASRPCPAPSQPRARRRRLPRSPGLFVPCRSSWPEP